MITLASRELWILGGGGCGMAQTVLTESKFSLHDCLAIDSQTEDAVPNTMMGWEKVLNIDVLIGVEFLSFCRQRPGPNPT